MREKRERRDLPFNVANVIGSSHKDRIGKIPVISEMHHCMLLKWIKPLLICTITSTREVVSLVQFVFVGLLVSQTILNGL